MLSCKQATEISNKLTDKEKISLSQKISFYIHLMICKLCANYHKQNKFIQSLFSKKKELPKLTDKDKNKLKEVILKKDKE